MSSVRDDSDAHHGITHKFTLLLYADVAPALHISTFKDLEQEKSVSLDLKLQLYEGKSPADRLRGDSDSSGRRFV